MTSPLRRMRTAASTAASAKAGTIVTHATRVPAAQRATAIDRNGTGDSQVKGSVPARTSA